MSSESAARTPEEPRVSSVAFILEARYQGEPRVVADGVYFPSGQVAVDWRNETGTELIPSLDALYDKYGQSPRVLWEHDDGTFSEAEPAELTHQI